MHADPRLTEFLNRQLAPSLDLLQRMVAINSFTANRTGVNQLGRLTAESFAGLGFAAEFVPSTNPDYGDHLVLTRKGRSARTVGLISHLDTVFPPEEEARNEFHWRPEGDRIYGPGTNDIKGGTVLLHLMLSALRETARDVFEEITWIALLDASEETLCYDFGDLCLARLKDHGIAALVFESGARAGDTFSVVTARKGRATFRVEVEGRGAHAGGNHERGANAITQIAHTIQRIAALTDYSKALTFNVGTIAGGTVANRVPHYATAEVEMRGFTPEAYRAGVDALLALNNEVVVRSAEDGHPCRVSIRLMSETPPWPRNEGTDKLLGLWQQAGRDIGLTVVSEERGGVSDGNFLWQSLPTLDGLGPNGDHGHCSERSPDGSKDQEYVEVSSLVPKAALNVSAILQLTRAA